MSKKTRIKEALDLAYQYSQIDGAHHKAWVIDQMVRALTEEDYGDWIKKYVSYNPTTKENDYEWDEGVAP